MNACGKEKEDRGPLAAARRLRGRTGLAYLDSSLAGQHSSSLIAAGPDLVLSGGDWDLLEAELDRRSQINRGMGTPQGAAIGWVSFDGTFHFAFYDRVHIYLHSEARWLDSPDGFDPVPAAPCPPIRFEPQMPRAAFMEMVERARAYIAAGDIYQVCLAHPFVARTDALAWDYYETLRRCSPAPHAAYIDGGDLRIASASPECFLRLSGRRVLTRPIKGTRPRKSDTAGDRLSASDLVTSPKEIAELVMITDLERNDLGQVCEIGSVTVSEMLRLEAYEQVFHLVSTVEGVLRPDVTHVQALRACFPGGSISGAPKKRALEIIRELEPFPRGIYTGAIGYFGFNGESQFSIAIRTAVFESGRAHFHAGAGIVADSIPEREWQETLDKASGLLAAGGG
jgi:anthranilate/para-aminobenzoate synthase component I